jgi:hypothetical protein
LSCQQQTNRIDNSNTDSKKNLQKNLVVFLYWKENCCLDRFF